MTVGVIAQRPEPAGESRPTKSFRGDLEGLRAVAVVLVLLDHLFQWPRGGFIGVDVFFVLSGFLITGLLLKEYDRTGTISFRRFYLRRVKRILPVSTLVIVVTAVGGYTVFLGARAHQALTDGLWSLLFAANWRFVLVGRDYFAQDRSVSPFQHYWSLAVEEQFYFVWPLLLFVSLAASARLLGGSKCRWVLGGLLGAITVTSLIWSLLETSAGPLVAYFSTFSRAWELSVGGLLALLVASRPTICRFPRSLPWLGLLTIAVAAVLIDPSSSFPGPWALLPVTGALLVIAAGVGVAPERLNRALTHSASRYVGKISFSLYLWHWPVIVIASALLAEGTLYFGVAVGATAILSVASFHLIEDPIRRSSWLTRPRGTRSHLVSEYRARRLQAAGLVVLGMVTAVTVGYALIEPRTVPALAEPASAVQPLPSGEATDRPGEGGLSREIQIAIEARDWPAFRIDLDALEDAKVDEWTADGCINVSEVDLARCTYDSPAEGLAVVVGDSVAVSWLPAIRGALEPNGYATLSLTMGQCPAAHVAVESHDDSEGFSERCADHTEWATSIIDRLDQPRSPSGVWGPS